jgi:hypothetical protein
MIRLVNFFIEDDVTPQAIFWRPLRYFTNEIRTGEDDLDKYEGASFCIGNTINFDLRKYRGHPEYTVTLYLSYKIDDLDQIIEIIANIVRDISLPNHAVAWRRGEPYQFGSLERRPNDRLREKEARVLALKLAALSPHYTATTESIKQRVPDYYPLSEADLIRSKSRPNERHWQQIVGNVISHQNTTAGPFRMGYAKRIPNGLSVTELGLDYLNNIGFFVSSGSE